MYADLQFVLIMSHWDKCIINHKIYFYCLRLLNVICMEIIIFLYYYCDSDTRCNSTSSIVALQLFLSFIFDFLFLSSVFFFALLLHACGYGSLLFSFGKTNSLNVTSSSLVNGIHFEWSLPFKFAQCKQVNKYCEHFISPFFGWHAIQLVFFYGCALAFFLSWAGVGREAVFFFSLFLSLSLFRQFWLLAESTFKRLCKMPKFLERPEMEWNSKIELFGDGLILNFNRSILDYFFLAISSAHQRTEHQNSRYFVLVASDVFNQLANIYFQFYSQTVRAKFEYNFVTRIFSVSVCRRGETKKENERVIDAHTKCILMIQCYFEIWRKWKTMFAVHCSIVFVSEQLKKYLNIFRMLYCSVCRVGYYESRRISFFKCSHLQKLFQCVQCVQLWIGKTV